MKNLCRKHVTILLFVCLLVTSLTMSSCSLLPKIQKEDKTETDNDYDSSDDSSTTSSNKSSIATKMNLQDLKEKYDDKEKVRYTEPVYNVSPKEYVHKIPLDFSVEDYSDEQLQEMFNVYTDSTLENTADPVVEYDQSTNTILLKPNRYGILSVGDREDFAEEEYSTWGNISKLYFTVNIDTKTGEKLEKPIVTVVTFFNGLEAPTASFRILDDGRPGLTWTPVEGADKYFVGYTLYTDGFHKDEEGTITITEYEVDQVTTSQVIFELAEVEGTEYNDIYEAQTDDNVTFMNFLAAVDVDLQKGFCVIAMDENGHSLSSNVLKMKTIMNQLPSYLKDEFFESYSDPYEVDLLSTVSMLGTDETVKYPREFDFETAIKNAETESKQSIEDGYEGATCYVDIPYKVKGTEFRSSITLDGKVDEINEKIEVLQNRYEKESVKSAVNNVVIDILETPPADLPAKEEPETPKKQDEQDDILEKTEFEVSEIEVFATNALSEYLANQMLLGKEDISLDGFTEASNTDYLSDCIFEAVYQNPLILNFNGCKLNYMTNSLYVDYDDIDADTMVTKQNEIKEEVKRVVSEIITNDMSDLDKELAINKYLCDSAEYDNAACEHAMENNMQIVDPKFLDAFSAYGILVKKVGVCSSYAASFKLLADASGLEAIVVNGKLNGTINHAWNRVKIDNQWYSLDVTNNDNDSMANALFNLDDEEASKVLIEGDLYMCDDELSNYVAIGKDYEYYRMNQQYYESSDIDGIANALKEGGNNVVFRTDFDITANQVQDILEVALTENGYVGSYRYNTFLGVVAVQLAE